MSKLIYLCGGCSVVLGGIPTDDCENCGRPPEEAVAGVFKDKDALKLSENGHVRFSQLENVKDEP